MVEDIFSGLLEGLAEFLIEVLGELLSGVLEWHSGGGVTGGEFGTGGPVERYKFLPKDIHD